MSFLYMLIFETKWKLNENVIISSFKYKSRKWSYWYLTLVKKIQNEILYRLIFSQKISFKFKSVFIHINKYCIVHIFSLFLCSFFCWWLYKLEFKVRKHSYTLKYFVLFFKILAATETAKLYFWFNYTAL